MATILGPGGPIILLYTDGPEGLILKGDRPWRDKITKLLFLFFSEATR